MAVSDWLWKGWKAIDQASCSNEMAPTFISPDVIMMVAGSRDNWHRRIFPDNMCSGSFPLHTNSSKLSDIGWSMELMKVHEQRVVVVASFDIICVCGLGYFCATVNYVSLVSIKRKVSVCGCEDPWVD